jgi:antitoxin CptB
LSENQSILRKRLLYKATHRGIREADVLIGAFAKENIHKMVESELSEFDKLLDESDVEILAWAMDQSKITEPKYGAVLQQFCHFINQKLGGVKKLY